jgi:hypothetical protein
MADHSPQPRRQIGEALLTLSDGLQPFVAGRFRELAPDIADWTEVLRRKDHQAGRAYANYNPRDLSLLLRALTESFGALGYPFNGRLDRQASTCASELRTVRNRWAHNEEFSAAQAYRALDSMEILLRAIGDEARADTVAAYKRTALAELSEPRSAASLATPGPAPAATEPATPGSVSAPAPTAPEASSHASVTFELNALPVLSYAAARAEIPVIDEITVTYLGRELRGASVEIAVVSDRGTLGDSKVVIVDLDGTSPTVLRNVDVHLDAATMLGIDTSSRGELQVRLRTPDDEIVGESRTDVDVLAANHWMARPEQLALELLTAFVQPNSAAIDPLLLEASDLLTSSTGNSALDGYQQESPDRVDAIVGAVYEAIRARNIRYAEPPASWGLSGQKIRTPEEVLDGRLGTCMDTTVTLAAALEQAGINSTLWLWDRHIFLGWWRIESALEGVTSLDFAEMKNYVDLGLMGIVETTMMTGGPNSRPFAEAIRRPHTIQMLTPDIFVGASDIRRARMSRIYPLPSRTTTAEGDVVVHEYAAPAGDDPLQYTPSAEAIAGGDARVLPRRVSQWKNTLLDLSLRNRLINFGEKAGYPLAVPQPSLPQFEDMINDGTPITLLPLDRVPDVERARGIRNGHDIPEAARAAQLADRKAVFVGVTEAAYATRLRDLAHKARMIVEETGANNLYLAFGMLRWTLDDRELRSPLVLVPVKLEESGRGRVFRLTLDEVGESTPNYCLLEKLRVTFGLEVPGLANPSRDGSGIDLPAAFAAMRRALATARLPFTVDDSVELSILQFAKYRLWKDLDENWEAFAANPLVSHLINTPTEAFIDPAPAPADVDLDALSNAVPMPADSSQLEAVAEAAADRTFVLEGPPGTGKSQTITNLLAHALANGKRVLFVAEKRAALDVVKNRLDAVGLGPFSLDLHDKGARPNAVREQLRTAIDAAARPDAARLRSAKESARSSRETLRRYAVRLHEPNAAGLSLYGARSTLLASDEETPTLSVPASFVAHSTPEQVEQVRDVLRRLPESADLAHPQPTHPWGFVRSAQYPDTPLNTAAIHAAAGAFDAALAVVRSAGGDPSLLALTRSPRLLERWAQLARAPRFPLAALDALAPRAAGGELTALQQRVQRAADPASWFDRVAPTVLDADVESIHADALAADASGVFGRTRRRRAALARFGTHLRVELKQIKPRNIAALTGAVAESWAAIVALRDELRALPVATVPANWNPYLREGTGPANATLGWAGWLSLTLTSEEDGRPALEALRAFYSATPTSPALADALTTLAATWRALATAIGAAEPSAAADDRFAGWAVDGGFFATWETTRGGRAVASTTPVTLDRWVAFIQALQPLEQVGLSEAHALLLRGEIPADLATLAFDKGVAATSIDERRQAQALTTFDVTAHGRTITRFSDNTDAVRRELPRWLAAEIIERRRIDTSYDGGRMGELKRQIARKQRGMSVRQLFDAYGDLILQIAPCVLMSPESVARFLSAKEQMFDIVVFDEASQIRVADAVGAMGRGRSVVVVGDSKQMPPTSFAETSNAAESAEPEAVLDEESILTECVQARVPRKWLSWHYRSQDEALILFSNHAYYESRLSSFPAPWRETSSRTDEDHGISLVRVDGHFERSGRGRTLRTNQVEATAIVEEVARRFAASPDETPSLGIITFNTQQRALIETMLREAPDERITRALDERDGLFVKNLENVQGDERDVILFSVAFSANDKGVIPLNFGPLTRAGGERRLNVAITRARRQVILFASFDPSELRAEETTSIGIKHLKGYLELAASGTESRTDSTQREAITDRHRDEIAAELRYRGFAVKTDVGLSDFRVDLSVASADDPDLPLIAVLLDGDTWRTRRTVADRDGLPVSVLKGLMNWPAVERVWLPEWLEQREKTLDRLATAVELAAETVSERERARLEQAAKPGAPAVASLPALPDRTTSVVDETALIARSAVASAPAFTPAPEPPLRHPQLADYAPWPPRLHGGTEVLDGLPNPVSKDRVRKAILEVVAAEGPIHKVRLAKLVAGAFDLSRVAEARAEAILRCVPPELLRASDETSVWPAGIDPTTWRQVRRSAPGDGRDLDTVPLIEIANAMALVAELSGGMSADEIKREALSLFGLKRMTKGISGRLDEALRFGVTSRRLADEGGRLTAITLE